MEATRLLISGMNCEKCVTHVTDAIRGVDGVTSVIVSLKRKSALVRHSGATPSELVKAVESAGYGAKSEE